jgi:SagB-type dehydrogenase family enzyme
MALAPASVDTPASADAAARVRAYHQRSKHQLQRYAAGPETLDWDAQPDPFRRYAGAPLEPLPLPARALDGPAWSALFTPAAVPPRAVDRSAIGLLFELSFAISAWKQQGPDRWAVRCNPSSGNLHPTEAWLLAHGVRGLDDGLYHYAPREHALERRARLAAGRPEDRPRLWIGLGSIHWREAWKYGERAFRYSQLDAGHALGALRYAAAVLGWRAQVVDGIGDAALAALLGLDRDADHADAEREQPELLVELLASPKDTPSPAPQAADWLDAASWRGQANRLDRHPMYRWPVIDAVAAATRRPDGGAPPLTPPPVAASRPAPSAPAPALILGRRSAQRFDRHARLPRAVLERLLQALQPAGLPWDVRPGPARVHPVLFAHHVEGLAPGAYLLPRSAPGEAVLRAALSPALDWQPVEGLPLLRLAPNPALAGTLRTIDCHQALGSDASLAVAMLAEFDGPLDGAPWRYRTLYQEAGLLGQVLYLEAEAAGLRGTGIGCYFDDALHQLLDIKGSAVQSLYHFTLGTALDDPRIQTAPPYPHRPQEP